MKRTIVALALALLLSPCLASACEPGEPGCGTVDIKAYGNQVADYSVGAFDVTSVTVTNTKGVQGESTQLNPVNLETVSETACSGADCGTGVSQAKSNVEQYDSANRTTLTGRTIQGTVNMSSVGAISACVSGGTSTGGTSGSIPYSGSFSQSQSVRQSISGELVPGITGSASYCGTQTISLKVGAAANGSR